MVIVIENEGRKIIEFSRDKDKQLFRKDTIFEPYFYVHDLNGDYQDLFGSKVKKIIVQDPSDVPKLRESYSRHYEANVIFVNRYLIDAYDGILPEEPLRKCFIDLEIEVKGNKFPDVEIASNMIQSIACYDSFLEKFNVFCVYPESWKDKGVSDNNKRTNYFYFNNEKDMLNKFIQYIQTTDPDIILAWNGDTFDFPYLLQRLRRLKLWPEKLSRLNKIRISAKGETKIYGRVLLDMMWMYKVMSYGNRESYSLEYISQYEIGEGKEKYDGTLQQLYETDFANFIDYNIRDVELLVLLDKKMLMVSFFDAMRRFGRCLFTDVLNKSKILDSVFLCYSKGKYALPTDKYYSGNQKIVGAFVWLPKPGIFKRVAVFDWKSLYPNIIRTFNLSIERLLLKQEADSIIAHILDSETKGLREVVYLSPEQGLLSKVMDDLLTRRVEYKDMRNACAKGSIEWKALDNLQRATKEVANSGFGVLKDKSRISQHYHLKLQHIRIAEIITSMGQILNKQAAKFAEEHGYKVIYGDTDSIFILMEDRSIDELKALSKLLTQQLANFCRTEFNCQKSYLEFEFEKIFKRVLFCKAASGKAASKKRYAYWKIWEDGKDYDIIDATGFEMRRSDYPQFIRNMQKHIFDLILHGKGQAEVDAYVAGIKKKFYSMREEIGMPKGISKPLHEYDNQPQIRGARHSNKYHGTNFGKGSKVKFIYLKASPQQYPQTDVISFENKIPPGYKIDYDKMYKVLVQSKIDIIYESLGWGKFGIQTGLDQW